MSENTPDLTPKSPAPRRTGLSPKEQKLQALREKLAQGTPGSRPNTAATSGNMKAKSSFTGKKTAFQRKAT